MSVSMIQGGIVMVVTYLLAMFMILAIGPVIDEVDNMRDTVDTHTFNTANLTFDSFHAWFYGVIVAGCALVTVWFFMIVHAKVVLRRQERMMYGNYQYTRSWGMRPR